MTVTFIDGYVNRKNSLEVHAKFKNIMKRLKYRFGNIEYLAVPEFHKDRAIHYHVMINFKRQPKLKYDRSRGIWHFHKSEKLKRNDCFLALKKLQNNNYAYLVKYMTKGFEFPLARRFSASRGLKRSRLVAKVELDPDKFHRYKAYVEKMGFTKVFNSDETTVLTYDHTAAPRAAVDLLIVDTKDEKNIAIWLQILEAFENIDKNCDKVKEIYFAEYEKRKAPEKKESCKGWQLDFDMVFNMAKVTKI